MDLFSLENQVAFVTGAGSGIGQRIAVGLAEAGANVACFDLPGSVGVHATLEEIEKFGRKAIQLEGDVVAAGDMGASVDKTIRKLGGLDMAVNCAGIVNASPAEDMATEQWRKVIDVNLTGVFNSCQAEARVMLVKKAGSIVNIASISGRIVNRGLLQAHYNASKAGVIQLTKSLAMEWVGRGVRVNAISPGYIMTGMNARPEAKLREFAESTPMGRLGTVDELVGPAIFLCSRASSFCTGHDLIADGGFVCW